MGEKRRSCNRLGDTVHRVGIESGVTEFFHTIQKIRKYHYISVLDPYEFIVSSYGDSRCIGGFVRRRRDDRMETAASL